MRFKHLFAAAALAFSATAVSPAMAANCPAEGFVKSAGSAFVSAANSGSPQAFVNAASRFSDLRGVAMFALGYHRKEMPKALEAEYVRLARDFMGRKMAKYAGRISGANLTVTTCSGNTVTAVTSSGNKLVFRLSGGPGSYRVQDVNVSSIWLAGQMRSTFAGVMNRNNGGVPALMAYLRR
ncbi:MAG: ABC transporter substrate-binding protein [Hyphomicrobiales bacterium]